MATIKSNIRSRKGGAIIFVMFIVMLLMISGTGILCLGYQSRRFAIRTGQDMACRVCTDAGLTKAIDAMNTHLAAGTLNDGALPSSIGEILPAAEGAFSYRVTKNADGNYVAASIGARGEFRRTIVATLSRKIKTYFDHGVMSRGACIMSPGMHASAYDSQNPSATGLKIQMGTLSTAPTATVVVKPGGVVEGDLFCGAGGDPSYTICNDGTLTGAEYALTENPEIAIPVMPATLTPKPDFHTNGNTVTLTPASSGRYGVFSVDNGKGNYGKLVIDGGTVTLGVTTFLNLDNSAEIVVKEGSTLILYVASNIDSGNGASISYEGTVRDPSHIQIYGTGAGPGTQTWALKAKNDWIGVVYAPYSNISLSAGRDVYGSMVANNAYMDIKDGYGLYYDINLARATNIALSGPGQFVVKRWTESTIGTVPDWAH